tara:strand:- start:377 stop:2542 length:2166 start_codon:yes stop_codon:yes gene_type:complete
MPKTKNEKRRARRRQIARDKKNAMTATVPAPSAEDVGVLHYRADAPLRASTLDEETKTVDAVLATERPVRMFDSSRWEPVDDLTVMDGVDLSRVTAAKGRIPLLNSHRSEGTEFQLGSVDQIRVDGDQLIGRITFSATADDAWTLVTEGHLSGVSIGYEERAISFIEPGETSSIAGREFTAADVPLRVAKTWTLYEASLTPIQADIDAQIRARKNENQKPKQRGKIMNAAVKNLLIENGMDESFSGDLSRAFATGAGIDPDMTADQVAAFRAATIQPEPKPATPTVDTGAIKSAAVADERSRIRDIRAAFQPFADSNMEMAKVRDECLSSDITIDGARAKMLDVLATTDTPSASIRVDEADHRRANMVAAVQKRVGRKLSDEDEQRAAKIRCRTMFDIAEDCVRNAGLSTSGSRHEIVGRAFTATGDFPYVLENSVAKTLRDAYDNAPVQWSKWTARGSASDFKSASVAALSESGIMSEVPEGAEFPAYAASEEKETIQLKTYGKILSITRQAIVNDDLSAFDRIPTMHGRAWARTINQLAVQVLLTNAALTDTVALFHASHSNLDASTAAVSSKATAEAVIRSLELLLMQQTDVDGSSYLNLSPAVIVTGPTLKNYYVQALAEQDRADNNRAVDIAQLGIDMVADPEIENATLTGAAANLTYMLASPADAPVVEVRFLDGNDAPRLEQETGFAVDGVRFKVAGDCAAAAIDYRGATKHVN